MESRLVRMIRSRRFDRNPLRRPSDRAETLIYLWLLVFFGILAPLAAHAAGGAASAFGEHMKSVALATKHEVTAVTLERAPDAAATPYAQIAQFWVNARWAAPDGQSRAGQILVPGSTPADTAMKIWVAANGTVVPPPLQQQEIVQFTDVAAASGVIVLAVALLGTWAAARRALDRQRMAAWEAEWAAAEPRWNRQSW